MAAIKVTYQTLNGKATTLPIGGEMTVREFLEDVAEISVGGLQILVNGSVVNIDNYVLEDGDYITMSAQKSTNG